MPGSPSEDEFERLVRDNERLRTSEALLRDMLAAAPGFIAHLTPDAKHLYLNRLAEGFTLEAVLGSTVYSYVDPAYHQVTRHAIAGALSSHEEQEYMVVAQGAHGEPRSYLTKVSPVVHDGVASSVVMVSSDVTALVEARAALRQQQLRLEVAVQATNLGIWSAERGSSGEVTGGTWDATTRRIFGYAEDDPRHATPHLIFDRVHPDDRVAVRAAVGAAFEARGDYVHEHRVCWPDGQVRHVVACGRVTDDESGETCLVGSVLDVTERKDLETRLLASQKLESIGRLAGGIAHDFNNLLTTITTAAELLRGSIGADQGGGALLDDILLAADRGAALTRQLLGFARRQVFEPRVVDPNLVVQGVESLIRRVLGAQILLSFDYRAEGRLHVDPSQLEQVILNMVTNARDAMPDGGELGIVTSDAVVEEGAALEVAPGSYVRIVITDTGCGIPSAEIPQVFEPFYSTKGSAGTGLGLATCYGIVKQNAGAIRVRSRPGRGTSFEIYLPRTEQPLRDERSEVSPVSDAGGRTILLVEDDDFVRRLLYRTLRARGYRVLVATDGNDALELVGAHEGRIDLLLTDLVLPHLGGRELASLVLRTRPGIAVVYMSGYAEDVVREGGALPEGVHFLQKPFLPAALLQKISEALGVPPLAASAPG